MKRIVSFLMVVSLLLSLCGVGYASNTDYTQSEEILTRCIILEGLGIVPPRAKAEYYKTDLANDRTLADYGILRNISKSAFINYLCNIYGEYGYTDDYNEDAIHFAEEMGIIHKGQTDLNKSLCYDEALTMLVRMLGYELHAEERGGFPTGYLSVAFRLGLTEGVHVQADGRLRDYEVAYLLYNAINCAYVDEQAFTEDGIIYGTSSEDTLLYELRKIYKVTGVIDATESVMLRPGFEVPKDGVMLDGYVYKAKQDFAEYAGLNVEAYIQKTNGDLDEVLIAVGVRNQELVIQDKDIAGISPDFETLQYYSGDSDKKVTISPVAKVLYNGQPLITKTQAKFQPAYGSIRMIDNDGVNGYDVVFITSYQTVVVDSLSKVNQTVKNVFTHNAENTTLNLDDSDLEDIIRIEDQNGAITFAELAYGDVLTVATSDLDGKTVTTVKKSSQTIEGVIEAVRTKDELQIQIMGTTYAVTPEYRAAIAAGDSHANPLTAGLEYVFHLDSNGKIAYADYGASVKRYGIVVAKGEEGNFNKTHYIKLYTTNGKFEEYTIATKIEYEGSRGVETKNIFASIPSALNNVISVIAYEVNDQGEISMIDLPTAYDPDKNVKDTDFNAWENQEYSYRYGNLSFDSAAFMEDDSVMMKVNTTELQNEMSYSLTSRSVLEGDKTYKYSAYEVDEYGFAKLFIFLTDQTSKNDNLQASDIMVVESVGEALDAEGEAVGAITGMMGNYDSVTYYCDDQTILSQISKGDVLSVGLDSEGYVSDISIHRSLTDTNLNANPNIVHSREALVHGKVELVNASQRRLKINCGEYGMRTIKCHDGMPVFIYDSEDDRFYRGTLADVEKGNLFTSKLRGSKPHAIVVYR